jgi:predicted RNase H-like HicB family nuclease
MKLNYNILVHKENDTYVAYSPQLDISSCGKTVAEARKMLSEAVELFIKEAQNMNTLNDILQECGFKKRYKTWVSPPIVEIATAEYV